MIPTRSLKTKNLTESFDGGLLLKPVPDDLLRRLQAVDRVLQFLVCR